VIFTKKLRMMLFMTVKQAKYPSALTSYDVLKALAVLIMIVDHIGAYFYPDDLIWRAVGRSCVPMWFFLIGYARSRLFGMDLWIGFVILVVADVIIGMGLLPLNIMLSMLITRFVLVQIDRLPEDRFLRGPGFKALVLTLAVCALPTAMMWDYGSLGVILALLGWLVRKYQDGNPFVSKNFVFGYAAVALVIFALVQLIGFGFSESEFLLMALLCAVVIHILPFFKSDWQFSGAGMWIRPAIWCIQFAGRNTLQIYVVHLLLFKIAAFFMMPAEYGFLTLKWF